MQICKQIEHVPKQTKEIIYSTCHVKTSTDSKLQMFPHIGSKMLLLPIFIACFSYFEVTISSNLSLILKHIQHGHKVFYKIFANSTKRI